MPKIFKAKEPVTDGNQYLDKDVDRHDFDNGDAYPVDESILPVVQGYKSGQFIGQQAAPEVPVDSTAFTYPIYNEEDILNVAKTEVGQSSDPNELNFKGSEGTGRCDPHALIAYVPRLSQMQKRKGQPAVDPKLRAANLIMYQIMFAKELRVRDKFQDPANYGANTVQLSGTAQFNDYANSDPDGVFTDAVNALAMPVSSTIRKCMAMPKTVWDVVRKHPQLVALLMTSNDPGKITKEAFMEEYYLDELLISDCFYNAAGPGQPVDKQQVWQKHISVFYKDMEVEVEGGGSGITFACSPKFMDISDSGFEQKPGVAGVHWVKAGHVESTIVMAPSYGYFIEDAIA